MAAAVERGAFVFYAASVAVLLVGVALTWRGLRESSGAGSAIAAGDLRRYATDWLRPLRSPRFFWVFNARVLVILGLNLFLTFIEYYFARVAHVRDFVAATAGVALLALAGALASAVLVGRLSDHISRVPLVAWATLLMAVAAATFVVVPNAAPLPVLGIVFGLGYGAYTSVDWALAVDSLPSAGAAGRDMGVWNIASTLPSVAAPLLGGLLIAAVASSGEVELGYRGVFGLAALCFVLGALALRRVATFA
jgi:MFS family permease